MKVIYKYPLRVADVQDIALPVGAQVLSAQMQRDQLCIWAMFDMSEARVDRRRFTIVGTGNQIPDGFLDAQIFVGTVQAGIFVWHIFVSPGHVVSKYTVRVGDG